MLKKIWNKLRGKKTVIIDDNDGLDNCVPEIPYVSELEQLPSVHTKKKSPKKKVKKARKSKRKLLLED